MTSDVAGTHCLPQTVREKANKGFISTCFQVHHGSGNRLETVHWLLKFLLSSDKVLLLPFYWPKQVPWSYLTLKGTYNSTMYLEEEPAIFDEQH